MKTYFLLFLLPFYCFFQIETKTTNTLDKDTTMTLKSSWYARSMFVALTTGSDTKGETLSQRMTKKH